MGYFNTKRKKRKEKNGKHLCSSENELGFAEVASNANITTAFYIKKVLSPSTWPLWFPGLLPYMLTRSLQQKEGVMVVHRLLTLLCGSDMDHFLF